MSDDNIQGKKKIIVDEDWKSQVEAEKEAARQNKQQAQADQPAGAEEALPAPTLIVSGQHTVFAGGYCHGLAAQSDYRQIRACKSIRPIMPSIY